MLERSRWILGNRPQLLGGRRRAVTPACHDRIGIGGSGPATVHKAMGSHNWSGVAPDGCKIFPMKAG